MITVVTKRKGHKATKSTAVKPVIFTHFWKN